MRLPPLNALRAFEAAARHGGYIAAAEELCVTRGAVSRHVKALEAHLGVALFRRHARGVSLTAEGRRLQPVLHSAFGQISDEVGRLVTGADVLRVLCPPATSIRWLIPKLDLFRARHPDIEVELTTSFHGSTERGVDAYDIGFSVEHWPRASEGVLVEPLFPVLISPACTPHMARELKVPRDLVGVTLLHETLAQHDWRAWLSEFPVEGLDLRRNGSAFPNLDLAMRAALMGAGVVMADVVLCRDELAAGALVLPFADRICAGPFGGVSLIGARDAWDTSKVSAFRSWAQEMALADIRAVNAACGGTTCEK
ncbi:MAG: LysR substrate-binding domain-containing protein [Pseudomonadota bacterium]